VSLRRDRSSVRSRLDLYGSRRPMTGGSSNAQWALAICFGGLGFVAALIAAGITKAGHTIDMAVMHFLLFYGGVFALIGLTAAVGAGLLASDRIVMTPSRRIVAQAVHRAVSFGAMGFLLIHIVTEIVAGRARPLDAVVPGLGQTRALYLSMGTLASDLLLLILVTGILRRRFATVRPTWLWRALHATAYVAWPLGVLHGLLDGRTAKPYVDWSYGACVAAVALALIVRLVVAARVQETASSPVPSPPPWLNAGGAGPWVPGGTMTQLEVAPARPGPAVAQRPPLALPAPPPRSASTPPRGTPVPPRSASTPPRGTPMPPRSMSTPPRGTPMPSHNAATPPRGSPFPPRTMSTPPRGTSMPPRSAATPPRGSPFPPRSTATPPRGTSMPPRVMPVLPRDMPVPPRGASTPPRGTSAPPGAMPGMPAAPRGMTGPPRSMAPPSRGMPPPSPPLGMPAYPGHATDDHGYPGQDEHGYPGRDDPAYPGRDDPADYYYGPGDEDDDPGWADGGYPDAEEDDPGQPGGGYGPGWADDGGYGPGPGPPYPHADTSHGWAW